jgi:hypothetical protein
LTGDVKLEMLEGPTGGTKDATPKIKFLQVEKVPSLCEKADSEQKKDKKEKKCKLFQTLDSYLVDKDEDEEGS